MKKILSIASAFLAIVVVAETFEIYAPRSGGVAGQILKSAGEKNEPVWTTETLQYQTVLDVTHPIGSVWIQYSPDDNPNTLFNRAGEYTSIWDDITLLYDARYECSSSADVGTQIAEEMAIPTFDLVTTHYHDKGDMNITGRFGTFASYACDRETVMAKWSFHYSWVTTKKDPGSQTSFTTTYIFNFDTDYGGWTGLSSVERAHTPSIASPALYKAGAAHIQPMTSTVKIWKRSL